MVKYASLANKLFFLLILSWQLSCQDTTPPGITHMTPDLWEEDLDYLNRKIQKEFKSFDPTVKDQFKEGINTLKKELTKFNNDEIAIKTSQLLAGLGDGHTELSLLEINADFNRLPLILYFFEDKLYIVGAHKSHQQFIGSQILKIGNQSVPEVFSLLKTVMTHDNDYEILHAGTGYLLLTKILHFLNLTSDPSSVNLTLKKSDNTYTENVSALPIEDYIKGPWVRYWDVFNISKPLYAKKRNIDHWYEYLEDQKTMYFYYGKNNNQSGKPSIKKVVKQLFDDIDKIKPEKLIVDMRRNRGGNYHKSRPLIEAVKKRAFLNKKGKIYVITGRTTFSAAMVTSIFFKKETNAILIGEPSRGHPNKTDNVEHMNLPNSNLLIEYTTKVKKHWPELNDLDHVPVDIKIVPNFTDYSKGIDPVLRYIYNN